LEKPAWQSLGQAVLLRFALDSETKLDMWGRKRECKACGDEEDHGRGS